MRRKPQVTFCVVRAGWRPYVTVYGRARIEEQNIVEGTAAIMRRMTGNEPPDGFAQRLEQQGRVLIIITPEHFVP